MSGLDARRTREYTPEVFEALDRLERLLTELPEHRQGSECVDLLLELRRVVTAVLGSGGDNGSAQTGSSY